jgi:hypothetical protein
MRAPRRLLTLATLVLTAGCTGFITEPGKGSSVAAQGGGSGNGTGGGASTTPPVSCPAGTGTTVGHYTLRPLTNTELTNTVQDLLFTTLRPGDALQTSPAGSSGYTNDSNALSVYSQMISIDYAQAELIAHGVIASKGVSGGAYAKLVTCQTSQASCAQSTVSALARRALRRGVTSDDLDPTSGLMAVFTAGGSFDQGLNDVIVTLLMHPEFLMIPVVDAQSMNPAATFSLTDDEVASRLSYFLWQSMPDAALFAAADAKTLHDPTALAAQVKRMLADPRAQQLKVMLRDQYAELSTLAVRDFTQVGQPNTLRDAFIGETDAFFNDLITQNRSALSILDGKQTFANKQLADFYGLTFPSGTDTSSFVPLSAGRTGLGSHGSVLINTAGGDATFTNPIKRGHWLMKKMLCASPPPPPPNVPALPPPTAQDPTVRERLAQHTANPVCAACHVQMDAVGLGAENYDAFGRWRTTYSDGTTVDATGTFADGTAFANSHDLYGELANQTQARSCVVQQFMMIGLSRALTTDEQCMAQQISRAALVDTASLADLVAQIASSPQFLNQTGEAP